MLNNPLNNLASLTIGDFPILERDQDNFLNSRVFGIPILLLAAIGLVIYLVKK